MIKIVWTDSAVLDLNNIHSYISRDSNVYADALLLELFCFVDKLKQFPLSGRIVPELNDENTREIIVGNYRVIYDIVPFNSQDFSCFAWRPFIFKSEAKGE